MQIALFTKIFTGRTAAEIGTAVNDLGLEALDLAIRAGQCVEPATVRSALPEALRVWREMGITVPMVTLQTDATDPQAPETQAIFEACGEAGIPLIKLGYWRWKPGDDYWQGVSDIRRALDGFQQLSARTGVCSLLHTHSGDHYFENAAGAMHVAHGLDPQHIGIYLDPGHLALNGESVPLALAIVKPYLRAVGVKNVRHMRNAASGRWDADWCPLEQGLVAWDSAVRALEDVGFDGPLSFHAQYSDDRDLEGGLRLAINDVKLLKSHLARSE